MELDRQSDTVVAYHVMEILREKYSKIAAVRFNLSHLQNYHHYELSILLMVNRTNINDMYWEIWD